MSHTPEPWELDQMVLHGKTYAATGVRTSEESNMVLIKGSGGARSWTREICRTTSPDDASRIVDCVNAIAGIDDPVNTIREIREMLSEAQICSSQPITDQDKERVFRFRAKLSALLSRMGDA